jgi:hypothetical protein
VLGSRVPERADLEVLVAEVAKDESPTSFYEVWECDQAEREVRSTAQVDYTWLQVPRRTSAAGAARDMRCFMHTEDDAVVELQVCKADRNEVEILTPIGWQTFTVPRSSRGVHKAWDSVLWIEADRKAHEAIIKAGNRLVRRDAVPADAILMNVVTARKYKKDGATGRLAEHNPRKSRHSADGNRKKAVQKARGIDSKVTGVSDIADPTSLKLFFGFAAKHKMRLLKADIGDAYAKARRKRAPGYMRMCQTIMELDADGMEMVYELLTPLWGEQEAGFEWDEELHNTLTELGWSQVPGIPALYIFDAADGTRARLVKIVDDLLIAEDGADLRTARATVQALKAKYDQQVTFEEDPTAFAGYKVEYGPDRAWIKLSQQQKIIDAATTHAPWLRGTGERPADIPQGAQLQQRLDALQLEPLATGQKPAACGKRAQAGIGSMKYIEQGVMPVQSVKVHRLSSVMSNPPDDALPCVQAVVEQAHAQLDEGITFYAQQRAPKRTVTDGRLHLDLAEGAPSELEAAADGSSAFPRLVMGMLLTFAGASVLHKTKKVGVVIREEVVAGDMVKDIFELELVATVAVCQELSFARRFLRAMGEKFDAPTRVLTDSLSGARILNNVKSASRSRAVLWRCAVVQAMAREGEVEVVYVPDACNPSDFLTKWVPAAKEAISDAYTRGKPHGASGDEAT